jgi:hypothetical protein
MTKLLLTSDEGWSKIYDDGSGLKGCRLHFIYSSLAGEPPYTHVYLIASDGTVHEAIHESRQSSFDEDDYAQHTIIFSARDDSGIIFRISYQVDGRS